MQIADSFICLQLKACLVFHSFEAKVANQYQFRKDLAIYKIVDHAMQGHCNEELLV